MKGILVGLVAVAVGAAAWGFSEPEHTAIWIDAKTHLNATATKAVADLLGNESPLKTACWADFIRLQETKPGPNGQPPKTTEAEIESVKGTPAFAQSDDWHFVDLPLGTKEYGDGTGIPSAGSNDVVHAIQACIDLLEQPDGSPGKIVHVRALRFLVHLVGDIHQPLHVACAYWSEKDGKVTRIDDPKTAAAEKTLDDKGGNQLLTSSSNKDKNLHHDWDDTIPRLAVKAQISAAEEAAKQQGKDPSEVDVGQVMASVLQSHEAAVAGWDEITNGTAYRDWAGKWATDAIKPANKAYTGIQISSVAADVEKGRTMTYIQKTPINGFDEAKYEGDQTGAVLDQMTKASLRLAALLNSIKWAK